MPAKKKTTASRYESKAVTTVIRATSRASVQIDGKYYTVEFSEERMIPDSDQVNLSKERELLWDTVNIEVDGQVDDIYAQFHELKEK